MKSPPSVHTTVPRFVSRIVPVVVVTDAAQAVPMAEALLEGGIDVIEITLRSAAALAAIEAVAKSVPAIHVGAGTVTRAHEVSQVQNAGAQFALSPGHTPALIEAVEAAGLPFIPGVATPSEAMTLRDAGFALMKFFPAAPLGGVDALKAWGGPLADVRFCPTGGVSLSSMSAFLALPNVSMVGGSWLTPAAAMAAGDWAQITRLSRQATQASLGPT